METYKFRGKGIDDGEWHYGDLITWCGASQQEIVDWHTEDFHHFEVYGESVGQYTNLRDSDFTQIFEGDIVEESRVLPDGRKIETGRIGYIAFLQQEMGFVIVWSDSDTKLGHRHRGGGYDQDLSLKVIGNITDNPELVSWWKKQE